MASYVSVAHELHLLFVGEPVVYQEIVKAYSFKDGVFDPTDKIVHIAQEVLSDSCPHRVFCYI